MKKILILIAIILLTNCCEAKILDFKGHGNYGANNILYKYIKENTSEFCIDVVGYYCDVDDDLNLEVVGIVKSKHFHTLRGYKLIVLKEKNGTWKPYKSDIYFDTTYKIKIQDKKITYFSTDFYKNKKYTATIGKRKIKTAKGIFDFMRDRKVKKIARVSEVQAAAKVKVMDIKDFSPSPQKTIHIDYNNLSDRTKHYLDLK